MCLRQPAWAPMLPLPLVASRSLVDIRDRQPLGLLWYHYVKDPVWHVEHIRPNLNVQEVIDDIDQALAHAPSCSAVESTWLGCGIHRIEGCLEEAIELWKGSWYYGRI